VRTDWDQYEYVDLFREEDQYGYGNYVGTENEFNVSGNRTITVETIHKIPRDGHPTGRTTGRVHGSHKADPEHMVQYGRYWNGGDPYVPGEHEVPDGNGSFNYTYTIENPIPPGAEPRGPLVRNGPATPNGTWEASVETVGASTLQPLTGPSGYDSLDAYAGGDLSYPRAVLETARGFFYEGPKAAIGDLANAIAHPIQTLQGLGHAILHPFQTLGALKEDFLEKWNSGPAGQGQAAFDAVTSVIKSGIQIGGKIGPVLQKLKKPVGKAAADVDLPTPKAAEVPVGGGPYDEVRASNVGGQVHHTPSAQVTPYKYTKGPSVWMETADHQLTKSWGSSATANAYRQKQADLIAQGKLRDAIQMDIDDIRGKFGSKYDQHIKQMLEAFGFSE
jgi:hypothetical protein